MLSSVFVKFNPNLTMQKRKDLTNEDYNAAVFQEGHLQKVF